MFCIGVGLLLAFGGPALWRSVRSHVAAQPEYSLALTDIEITPPPAWVRADVKAEVLHQSGLPAKISILDNAAGDQLAQTFSLHPWVARVIEVKRSYPGKIRVELAYRRPVAMVEVSGGLLPVDGDGILLPPDGFSSSDTKNYLWIEGVANGPLGPVGTTWGDASVVAAARLAQLLQMGARPLQLHRIQIRPPQEGSVPTLHLQLVTRGGTVIDWGSAPDDARSAEPAATEKLARLHELANRHGTLDAAPSEDRNLTRGSSVAR